jgi:hypothetical protein
MTKIEKSIHFSSENKTQNKYQGKYQQTGNTALGCLTHICPLSKKKYVFFKYLSLPGTPPQSVA